MKRILARIRSLLILIVTRAIVLPHRLEPRIRSLIAPRPAHSPIPS
jgi:hypothetical protein